MKKILRKFLIFFLVFLIGIGAGVGGTELKEKFFPAQKSKAEVITKEEKTGPLVDLNEFIVNLEGGGMIRTEITVEGVNGKAQDRITEREVFLRDKVISILGAKGIDDIRSPKGQKELKGELIEGLNEVCSGQIKDVLFKSFVYVE
ncbi:MAG: flagellar basal body-associated FliL family protein [Desulfitobacteriia bacterium]|jgi:flagellar FliL protein